MTRYSVICIDQERRVLAILLVDRRYLMQLRDDLPGIEHPGVWGLFGGGVEAGEAPAEAIAREVREELGAENLQFCPLWSVKTRPRQGGRQRVYWFFEADFTFHWGHHVLREGQAAECFSFDDLAGLDTPNLIRRNLSRHHRLVERPSVIDRKAAEP